MALVDLLNTINDAGEREQLNTLLTKYSPVKDALERGDAVAGAFEKVRLLGLDPIQEISQTPAWVEFRKQHWIADASAPCGGYWDREAEALSESTALKQRIVELEAKGETEMTADDVKALANAQFEARMEAMRNDPSNPLVDRTTLNGALNAHAKFQENIFAALGTELISHQQKYGEALPVQEVLDYMVKTKENDPVKAYKAILGPRENRLEIEKLKTEAANKFEEGKAKGIEEAQARINGQRLPVDGGGSQRSGSAFMRKVFGSREKRADAGNTRLGSGSAAQEGLAAYQRKQMGSGSV